MAIDGIVDVTAIESVYGLDIDALEQVTGHSLDEFATRTDAEPVVPVEDSIDFPGIDIDTEAALSDRELQRLPASVQQQLDDV